MCVGEEAKNPSSYERTNELLNRPYEMDERRGDVSAGNSIDFDTDRTSDVASSYFVHGLEYIGHHLSLHDYA